MAGIGHGRDGNTEKFFKDDFPQQQLKWAMLIRMLRQFFRSTGSARFRHERSAFEVKLALAETANVLWANAARQLVRAADKHFEAYDVDGAWLCLRESMRQELPALQGDQLNNSELVLRCESAKVQSQWRKAAIDALLTADAPGSRASRLERAQALLDDYYQTQYYRNALMRSQIVTLVGITLVTLLILMILIAAPGTALNTWEKWDWKTLLVVFLVGVLGASFSATRKVSDGPGKSNMPEMAAARSTILARTVLGATPALAAYAFLNTGLLKVGEKSTDLTPVILAVSFAAGFSERFVLKILESFGGSETGTSKARSSAAGPK